MVPFKYSRLFDTTPPLRSYYVAIDPPVGRSYFEVMAFNMTHAIDIVQDKFLKNCDSVWVTMGTKTQFVDRTNNRRIEIITETPNDIQGKIREVVGN